jgi:hypothetical protein
MLGGCLTQKRRGVTQAIDSLLPKVVDWLQVDLKVVMRGGHSVK